MVLSLVEYVYLGYFLNTAQISSTILDSSDPGNGINKIPPQDILQIPSLTYCQPACLGLHYQERRDVRDIQGIWFHHVSCASR